MKYPDYGNWVSNIFMRRLFIALGITLVAAVFSYIFSFSGTAWLAFAIRLLLSAFLLAVIFFTTVMFLARKQFSYNGGMVSSKVLDRLLSFVSKEGELKALDIGCGSGALSIKLAKKFPFSTVTGIDYWGESWGYSLRLCNANAEAENVKDRVEFFKGDAARLSFDDECFDIAVSNFVFHEVKSEKNKRNVVKEALRVVKKGGSFAFQDLFEMKSIYGDFDEFMQEIGAEVSELHFVDTSKEPYVQGVLKLPFMLGRTGIIYGIK